MRIEVVVVPVADVARAKAFYVERLGFAVDHDTTIADGRRLVQLTPPGSACSITIGTVGPTGQAVTSVPGSLQGVQMVVSDLAATHARLASRRAPVSDIQVYDGGALRPARAGDVFDNVGFFFFADLDGNGWVVQQVRG